MPFNLDNIDLAILRLCFELKKTITEIESMPVNQVFAMIYYMDYTEMKDTHTKLININKQK